MTTSPDPCRRVPDYEDDQGTYLIGLDYQINDATLVYLSHRHGYRSGGLQLRANLPNRVARLSIPRRSTIPSSGLKTTLDLGPTTLRLNTALFYSDYQDIQRTLSYIPVGGQALSTVC